MNDTTSQKKAEQELTDELFNAIESRNKQRVKEALRAGASPYCENKEGMFPRQRAVQIGWFGGAQLLLIEEQKKWLHIMHENPQAETLSFYKAGFLYCKYECQKWFSRNQ